MFVSDMFHGWNMKKIIEESPELKDDLSGFIWFPNTLSTSSITCASMPAIQGGYTHTINDLNKDTARTFYEKITEISENFVSKIKSKGYTVTSTDMIYSKIDKNKFDTYLPRWSPKWDKWNATLKIGVTKETGYDLLWENALLYSSPLFIKPQIYNN
jgi:hypothetical protein